MHLDLMTGRSKHDLACYRLSGQLGMAFQREIALRSNVEFADRSACDLAIPASLAACLDREQPSVIINCAAYTAVDAAEKDEATATRVNADAVGEIARWAALHDALMVQFSTDYVFNGTSKVTYTESAPHSPLSSYGRSRPQAKTNSCKLAQGVFGLALPGCTQMTEIIFSNYEAVTA